MGRAATIPILGGALGGEGDALFDGFDFFFADAFEVGEFSGVDGGGKFGDGGDAALFPEEGDGLGAQARDIHHGDQARGDAGGKFFQCGAFAGAQVFFDDFFGGFSDAFDFAEGARLHGFTEVDRGIT